MSEQAWECKADGYRDKKKNITRDHKCRIELVTKSFDSSIVDWNLECAIKPFMMSINDNSFLEINVCETTSLYIVKRDNVINTLFLPGDSEGHYSIHDAELRGVFINNMADMTYEWVQYSQAKNKKIEIIF